MTESLKDEYVIMSTNYYFKVKDASEIINKIKSITNLMSIDDLVMIESQLNKIHIGKRSCG